MTRQSHLSGIRHEHERSQGIPRTRPAATGPRYGLRALGRSGAATTVDDARLTDASAQVSSVTTNRNQPGPAWYVFVVAFPTADVAALTALIRQAYDSGDAVGMSVAGSSGRPRNHDASSSHSGRNRSTCSAGLKPSSFTACWSRLADHPCFPRTADARSGATGPSDWDFTVTTAESEAIRDALPQIDDHFWDLALWLGSKQLTGQHDVATHRAAQAARPLAETAGCRGNARQPGRGPRCVSPAPTESELPSVLRVVFGTVLSTGRCPASRAFRYAWRRNPAVSNGRWRQTDKAGTGWSRSPITTVTAERPRANDLARMRPRERARLTAWSRLWTPSLL